MQKSETIGQLSLALSRLQGEIQNVSKDKKGHGYMYAELSAVLDVVRPLCAKHELSITQLCGSENNGDYITVETVLLHSSGEWLSGTISLPVTVSKMMTPAQAVGSCISYGRRYSLAALVGIAQADNDAAVRADAAPVANMNVKTLRKLIAEHNLQDKESGWLEHFNVTSLDDLSPQDALKLIRSIEGKI